MSEKDKLHPFGSLGKKLKNLRSKRHESLAEVSGAVEIDTDKLSSIELGKERPSEDILLLLISYFGIKEDEAAELWKMAGYGNMSSVSDDNDNFDSSMQPGTTQVMVMPMDARIVYTDMAHVMVNDYGVVVNFMQGSGLNGQPLAVSRVGMSKDHAKSLIELLQKTLKDSDSPTQIKQLPEGQKPNSKSSDKTGKN